MNLPYFYQLFYKFIPFKKVLIKVYHQYSPTSVSFWISKLINFKPITFLQIGSNDGKNGDPLTLLINKNKSWKGTFVEPVPYIFKALKKNYNCMDRFEFFNVAINNGNESAFYWVDQKAKDYLPDIPSWFDQLGSFDKQHILKPLDGKLEPFINEHKIKGISLTHLLNTLKFKEIDLLHIDTEGYDWKILSQLDLKKLEPVIILVEVQHLKEIDIKELILFLNTYYYIFRFKGDYLCLHKNKSGIEKYLSNKALIKRKVNY